MSEKGATGSLKNVDMATKSTVTTVTSLLIVLEPTLQCHCGLVKKRDQPLQINEELNDFPPVFCFVSYNRDELN